MTFKALSILSTPVLAATILAGCGVSPLAGNLSASQGLSAQSSLPVVADGHGTPRRFGYKFHGVKTVKAPGLNLFSGPTDGDLPSSVDLRTTGKVSAVRDQGQLGSCTGFAMGTGLRETLTNMAGVQAKQVSPLFLYYQERVLENTVTEDSGASMADGMNVLLNTGVCLESTIPYNIAKFTAKPSTKATQEAAKLKINVKTPLADLNALKSELAQGHPGVIGFQVYESFMSQDVANTGNMPMPKDGEQIVGGHAVMIVGYDDSKQALLVKNSWGTGWGQKGYFWMPYAYVTPDRVDEIYTGSTDH